MKRQENQQPYLELSHIDKFFGITKALQDVTMKLYAGEITGLIGPNGAGKSTLMKIMTGVLQPTHGEILLQGVKQDNYSVKSSKEVGIACAYQDLSLCTNLSVFENFAMLNVSHSLGLQANWRAKAKKQAKEFLEEYFPGNGINVTKQVGELSLADQQIVEICKALMTENLKILVLDEPTSALSTDKANQLHNAMRQLSSKGVSIIYISHKIDEIRRVCDRIFMLKNGCPSGEWDADAISQADLIRIMGSGERSSDTDKASAVKKDAGEVLVEINHLSSRTLNDVNMVVRRGEIVGISGLAGSGQQELLQNIYAARRHIGKEGKNGVRLNSTVAYVSGDRAKEGVFSLWNIKDNILVANFDRVKGRILLNHKKCNESAQEWYDKLKFRAEGINSNIMSLSGGNQQKALIARGIASEADIIIFNDPNAGVDIGTKQDIYELLDEIRQLGKAIILYSTEDVEIEICDRAYIMRDGMVTEELVGSNITVANIVAASFKDVEKKNVEEEKPNIITLLLSSRLALPLLTMCIILAANVINNPRLLTYLGLRMKINSTLPLIFAALGQMFIVLCGDCDMGNGYSIGLVNVIVGILVTGSPFVGFVGLLIFIAAYVGMATLIHVRSIPAIVVTLGAQFVWYGVSLIICPTPGGSCPEWLSSFLRYKTPVVPLPIIIAVFAGMFCWYLLFRCRYGMVMRGIGNNPNSVGRSGWSFLQAKAINYGLAGLFVVFAGMAYTSTSNGADANSSANYCMMSIATVILGGCEMAGGVAEPMGVVAAAVAMSLINSLLTALKVDSNYQTAIIGLILIAVLAVKHFIRRKEAV